MLKNSIHGCRCTIDAMVANRAGKLPLCHHFAILAEPHDVAMFLISLQTIEAEMRKENPQTADEALVLLLDVKLASPIEGSFKYSAAPSKFKAAWFKDGPGLALLAGYWPETHVLRPTCRRPLGCAWTVVTGPGNWEAGFTIYGADKAPVLCIEQSPLADIAERLESNQVIEVLAEWASALG